MGHAENFADKLAAMKRERENFVKKEEDKSQVIQPKVNLNYPRKTDSFETAAIDHQSLADYFSSKKKQQHAIEGDNKQQVHHSINLLNGPPRSTQDTALSLVKNNSDLGNPPKKD